VSVSVKNSNVNVTSSMVYIESPQEIVQLQITLLQSVHESSESWHGIVKGGDTKNSYTKTNISKI
jgi:hypothetical protein